MVRSPSISVGIILTVGLLVAMLGVGCDTPSGTTITDDGLKIWKNILSPDGRSRIVIYQHDTGALGYGRVFWTVPPSNPDGTNLTKFLLPDGYRAEGWTENGQLEISKWQPYFGIRNSREIQDGDLFNGIKVKLVENNSAYALPGFEEPTSNQ